MGKYNFSAMKFEEIIKRLEALEEANNELRKENAALRNKKMTTPDRVVLDNIRNADMAKELFGYKNDRGKLVKTKTTGWTSCTEGFPKDNYAVNVVYVNHNPEPYYSSIKNKPFTAAAVRYNNEWYWWSSTVQDTLAEYGSFEPEKIDKDIEITHWAPFPEPVW